MSRLLLDTQTNPSAPSAGQVYLYPDSTKLVYVSKDANGRLVTLQSGMVTNCNAANVSPGATNFYLTGSALALGNSFPQVGTRARWKIGMTKSTAGTGTPAWTIVYGTAGTTADTARCTFTQTSAQTANTDTAVVDVECVFRAVGAAAEIAGVLNLNHVLTTTGFSQSASNVISSISLATFNSAVASSILGLCVDAGTNSAWTVQSVSAELTGI